MRRGIRFPFIYSVRLSEIESADQEGDTMWHEARRSERKVHDMMDAARKRAQRRAVYLAKRRGDPQQSIQVSGSRCRVYRDDGLYQATEDQQGLIPWNGKQDIMIDRFDGRALLDFIRDPDSRRFRVIEKTEEEEELEEFVSFERYRDLIKHRRRGCRDEEGLQHVNQEMEAKSAALFGLDRSQTTQAPANRGSYSQVGFSYDGDVKEENQDSDDDDEEEDDDEDEEDFNSDDSNDEGMDIIAKEFGVKRYGWLVYMDKKAKEEERRQKEVVKGDPAIRKLSRKERRKASQIERERERESARVSGSRVLHHDPYRESRRSPTYEAYSRSRRSRSRSYSPSQSRRHGRGHSDDTQRNNPRAPKIEYITEFGGSTDGGGPKLAGYTPPSSPPSQVDALNRSEHCSNYCIARFTSLSLLPCAHTAFFPLMLLLFCRPSSGQILEALHIDPASGVSLDGERNAKLSKPSAGSSSGLAKLNKPSGSGSLAKQQGEKKETPQERLKRIMSKQLNKQIKKDTAAEMAKKREQERQRLEKLAETNRLSRYRHRSRSRNDIAGTVEVQVGAEALEDIILGPVLAHVLYRQCGPLVPSLTLGLQGKTHVPD
ncbi:Suppressor of white apricot N-terminal domain-containing protein [Cynara cardunculus var. scolymus]|uniref:Suppressor of white apricot N-terminal domain-containing protein n=1 Tax=Cynara cardunculus var. scolymus TaxID=59895 RepID=A0A118K5F9_CYNCS|nr:Suppressor of white apricot N-terminal domain-containing protein [Cynara cardunculus var. scolymus]